MYCTKCGKQNKENARFCAFCGAPLKPDGNAGNRNTARQDAAQKGEEKKKNERSKKLLLITLSILIIFVAAAVTIMAFLLPRQREKKYRVELSDGNRYLEELDYEKAETSYLAAIAVEPKEEEPYLRLAEIYNVQGEPEKAVEILRQGVDATAGNEVREKYDLYTYVDRVLVPELGQCEEGEYTSKYVRTSTYVGVEPIHSQKGVLTSRIRDFDNDGNEELMVLVMTNNEQVNPYTDKNRNVVYLRMYESVEGEIVLKSEFMALYPVMGSATLENSGIFLQEYDGKTYICGTTYNLNYMTADGSSFNSFVFLYSGEKFEKMAGTDATVGGSEFRREEQNAYEMADYLDTIGLTNEAQQIRKSWMRRFDFSDPSEEMILHITGDSDGSADLDKFYDTMDPEYLGTVIFHLQTTWDNAPEESEKSDSSEAEDTDNMSGVNVTAEVYQAEYGNILDQTLEEYIEDMGEHLFYYFYDIDKNGVKELMVQTGTCEADYMYEIYTIKDDAAVYLGEIGGGHSSFFADENGGTEDYIIQLYAQMGYEEIRHISIQNKVPVSEEVSSREVPQGEDYYSNEYPFEGTYITDKSLLE